MSQTLRGLYAHYLEAKKSGIEPDWSQLGLSLHSEFKDGPLSGSDAEWLADALADPNGKWFVVFVLRQAPALVATPLFEPLIRAAVYERNPSDNRMFIEPCVRCVGWQRTTQALLLCVQDGTDFEKAGAVNGLYWALGYGSRAGSMLRSTIEDWVPDPTESQGESPSATRGRLHRVLLEEFVRNPNVDVRRSIVSWLSKPSEYPLDLRGLAEEAKQIALSHPDDYIRDRAEMEMLPRQGSKVEFSPLPHRIPPEDE